MEKMSKRILSTIISFVMLISMVVTVSASSTLPTAFKWSDVSFGVMNFHSVEGVSTYYSILYKDGDEVMTHTQNDVTERESTIDFRDIIVSVGSGTYTMKFVACENGEFNNATAETQFSNELVYDPSPSRPRLDTPQSVICRNNVLTWSHNAEGVGLWKLSFYAKSENNAYEFLTVTIPAVATEYEFDETDFEEYIYFLEAEGLSEEEYSFAVTVCAIPDNIVSYNKSAESDCVIVDTNSQGGGGSIPTPPGSGTNPGDGGSVAPSVSVVDSGECGDSATWSFKSDGTLTISGSGSITDNSGYAQYREDILKLVIESGIEKIDDDMFYELYNLSEVTIPNTVTSIGDGFLKGSSVEEVVIPPSVLSIGEWFLTKCESLETLYVYNPRCQIEFDEYAPMTSSATVYCYHGTSLWQIAEANGNDIVEMDPDFTVNGEIEEPVRVNSRTLSIVLNEWAKKNFTQFMISTLEEEGEYQDISSLTNLTTSYTLPAVHGRHGINISFKNSDGTLEMNVFKSVELDYTRKLTYKVNGEVYTEVITDSTSASNKVWENVEVGCGTIIPIPEDPVINNYRFEGWIFPSDVEKTEDGYIMPEKDVVAEAKMTKLSTIKGKVVDEQNAPVEGATVTMMDAKTDQTDAEGIFWLVQCEWGTHTINVTSGDKKKTVTFTVDDFSEELENITLSAAGSSAVVAPTTGVTSIDVAALEAELSDEDIAYAQTPGNTVNIETSVQEAVPTSNINDKATQSYSTYTQGKTIDITISKVKTGAEAGTTAVSEVSVPVAYEVEMPASLQGMGKFIVLREHDGQVDELTTVPNSAGEYIQVNNDIIKIVAAKFSTYTILGAPADPTPIYRGGGSSVTTYTVKFETNGASAIASVRIRKNGVVTMPESPVKDGFTFAGWYTDKACTKAYNFEEKVTKGFTLYAKWVEKVKKTLVLAIDKTDIEVDGTVKTNDVAPIIVNERAMLPIRFIAEELGAKVNWNGETQTVTVEFDDISIVVVIGESEATVNGEKVTLDSAPFIQKDRTFLPIRFVMEKLGADVLWNEEARTVTIIK